jgi:hypothetical protein
MIDERTENRRLLPESEMIRTPLWVAFVVVTPLLMTAFGQDQTDKLELVRISGRVVDPAGGPIARATVILKGVGANQPTVTLYSDRNGNFTSPGVSPKTYELVIEVPYFTTVMRGPLRAAPGKDIQVGTIAMEIDRNQTPIVVDSGPNPLAEPPKQELKPNKLPEVPLARGRSNHAIKAMLCDVVKDPERFNGKMVSVRGLVQIGFEDFELSASACKGPKIDGVWLEYGKGPPKQPTTWCCGDMIPQDSLPLDQNRDFPNFHRYLIAQMPSCCAGQCYLYSVTATITGRLDASKTAPCRDGRIQCCVASGFGHLGTFCARLVIESVSNVKTVRR